MTSSMARPLPGPASRGPGFLFAPGVYMTSGNSQPSGKSEMGYEGRPGCRAALTPISLVQRPGAGMTGVVRSRCLRFALDAFLPCTRSLGGL